MSHAPLAKALTPALLRAARELLPPTGAARELPPAEALHARLADYFLRRIGHPPAAGSPSPSPPPTPSPPPAEGAAAAEAAGENAVGGGEDEAHALLLAPCHLQRAGFERRAELIALLRSERFTAQLVAVEHTPPLPVLLLELLARGDGGARDAEVLALVEPEFGAMLAAYDDHHDEPPEEATARVHKVLSRVAKRFDLAKKAADNKARSRREEKEMRAGLDDTERAVLKLQKHARLAFGFAAMAVAAKPAPAASPAPVASEAPEASDLQDASPAPA